MIWEKKKVLVTGTVGFISSNLINKLLKLGADIYSIDNFSYVDVELAKRKINFLDKIKLIEGDISKKETWEKVPNDIEYIFHFAGPSSITLFKKEPEKCYNETIFGFWNALEFAKQNRVKKVIYPSSGSNYAGNIMPHKEDVLPKPKNLYAAAKIACEGLASSYSDFVQSIGLRIFGGYGPGEEWKKDFGSAVYLFINNYANGKAPEIWGDGNQTRDFIYIDDVVRAAIKAAEVDYTGIINVGTGRNISFRELLNTIKNSMEVKLEPTFISRDKNYVDNLRADTTLMREILNVEPIPIEEGIKKFLEYLKNSE